MFTFIQQDAVKFLEEWDRNKPIDIVFIDDWHSYDQVKKELEVLGNKVSYKTIILLHDLMYNNFQPFYHISVGEESGEWANGGPYRAVSELNPMNWEYMTLPWNNGMTLLRKKPLFAIS